MNALKRTPLYDEHKALGARLVDFGGWEMPVQYKGVLAEHAAVRQHVGLFDVSHMGEINVTGRGAFEFLQKMTSNDLKTLAVGQAQYSALPTERGTVVDDIIVYRRGQDSFFLCVNASNAEKDFAWLQDHKPASGVVLENLSEDYAQIAIQGPQARALMAKVVDIDLSGMQYYCFAEGKVLGAPAIIARTGYTGELGWEVYVPAASAAKVWRGLLDAGQAFGVQPAGLGARDTLRTEMGYALYGNDMDESVTLLEAGLGWITKLDKGEFIGRAALIAQKESGRYRRAVGLEMEAKAIPRHGHLIYASAETPSPCGLVSSGNVSPSTGKNVAMAMVEAAQMASGTQVHVDIRGTRHPARVVKKPFYTKGTCK